MKAAWALSLALAAFFIFNGCVPSSQQVKDPASIAGRLDLKVSPDEKASFAKDLAEAGQAGHGLLTARAEYFLGLAELQAGHLPEAGRYFLRCSTEAKGSGWDLASIYMMGATLEKMGDQPRAFFQYQRLAVPAGISPTARPLGLAAQLQSRSELDCQRLIAGMDAANIQKIIDYPASPEFQPLLSVRRISLLVDAHQNDEAFKAIESYFRNYPTAPYAAEVERLAREADKASPVDRHALGMLLPLSGPQAAYGLQVKQGADLAMEQLNAGLGDADKLKFVVADEGSNASATAAAVGKLVSESQVMAVLGPMSSEACLAALPVAASRRTLMLSPSAIRQDLANVSPYFFRNCLTPEKQGVAMADHALFDLRLTRVAALYPDSSYGASLTRAFSARVAELGAGLVTSVSYTSGSSDFKDLVVALGGLDPTALKDADTAEKRSEQAKVESASTKIGQVLLDLKTELEDQSGSAAVVASASDSVAAYAPLSFPAKVLVAEFAASPAAAQINAGRSLSDRFWRVLSQLDELKVLSPDESSKRLRERGLQAAAMNPSTAADFARSAGADFYLGGTVNELTPDWKYLSETAQANDRDGRQAREDIAEFSKNQVFQATVQLIDARSAEILAVQQFRIYKLKPPLPNSLGLQALYLPGTAAEVVQAASALKFCDMKLELMGSDLWDRPLLFKNDDVSALDGACFSSGFFPDSQEPGVKRFVEAYKRKYAAQPNLLSAQAYDAAMMLGSLIKGGASTREELRQALQGLKNFDGVSGRSTFGGRQDAVKRIPILRINSVSKTLEQVQ